MLFHQRLQNRLLESFAADDGTVGFDDDASVPAPFHNVLPSQPRMDFPLADADFSAVSWAVLGFEVFDGGFELVEVVDAVVGDADGADLAGLLGFDEGAPGAGSGSGTAVRGVD